MLQKDPFIPKKADRPLLEIPDFELKTERRAREREQFEITMKEREAQMEMALREVSYFMSYRTNKGLKFSQVLDLRIFENDTNLT